MELEKPYIGDLYWRVEKDKRLKGYGRDIILDFLTVLEVTNPNINVPGYSVDEDGSWLILWLKDTHHLDVEWDGQVYDFFYIDHDTGYTIYEEIDNIFIPFSDKFREALNVFC